MSTHTVMNNSSNSNTHGPEFVDCKELERLFGIRRSLAYELINRSAIRSVSLRKRGALKGKRLFDVSSVRNFLRNETERAALTQPVGGIVKEVTQ